jgi:uncharacterized protein YndB with AHSA1/START domain
MNEQNPSTKPTERILVINRIFDAPRELVFKMWTQPEHVMHWWAPYGFTMSSFQAETAPGGKWRASMRHKDGSEIWHEGSYIEVAEPERLSFTHHWIQDDGSLGYQTIVTVDFVAAEGKTEMTMRQSVFETASECNEHAEGWSECFDILLEYLVTV